MPSTKVTRTFNGCRAVAVTVIFVWLFVRQSGKKWGTNISVEERRGKTIGKLNEGDRNLNGNKTEQDEGCV